jgi:hypothetical protein
VKIKGPKMIKDDYNPSFYLKNMRKDLGLVIEAAKDEELCQLQILHFNSIIMLQNPYVQISIIPAFTNFYNSLII